MIVNERGFYDPLVALLQRAIGERFMDERHSAMWTLAPSVEAVSAAILSAPSWDRAAARGFAVP